MRYFFTMDGPAVNSAKAILEAQFFVDREHAVDQAEVSRYLKRFDESSQTTFAGVPLNDMSETFWIGHSYAEELGGLSIKHFVRKFTSDFCAQYGNDAVTKKVVKHINLITCQTGTINIKHNSAAQEMANYFHDYGFVDVCVHAIASPPTDDDHEMLVNVVTSDPCEKSKSRTIAVLRSVKVADIIRELMAEHEQVQVMAARLPAAERKHFRLERERQIEHQIKEFTNQDLRFMDTHNIQAELRRRQNTFTPYHPELRPVKLLPQELALTEIQYLMNNAARFKDQERVDNLKQLKNVIGDCVDEHWQRVLAEETKKFKPRKKEKLKEKALDVLTLNHRSRVKLSDKEVYSSLQALCKPALPTVSAAAAAASPDAETASLVDAAVLSPLSRGRAAARDESPPRTVTIESLASTRPSSTNIVRASALLFAASLMSKATKRKSLPMPENIQAALALINVRIGELEREGQSCHLFSNGVKAKKVVKLRALAADISADFLKRGYDDSWLDLIKKASRDRDLVRGVISHRTRDMFEKIIADNTPSERSRLLGRY